MGYYIVVLLMFLFFPVLAGVVGTAKRYGTKKFGEEKFKNTVLYTWFVYMPCLWFIIAGILVVAGFFVPGENGVWSLVERTRAFGPAALGLCVGALIMWMFVVRR